MVTFLCIMQVGEYIEEALEWSEQVYHSVRSLYCIIQCRTTVSDIKEFDQAMGYAEQIISPQLTDAEDIDWHVQDFSE